MDLTTWHQIKQWYYSTVESNMLNDKRIKSCLSRFDSGAYSHLQFLCAVSHLSALIRSPYSRGTTTTAAATKTRTGRPQPSRSVLIQRAMGRHPCRQRQLQGRRNRQRQPRQQPPTTVAICASWRHVLALHWCRADMRGSVKRVLCVCQLRMEDVLFVMR